MEFVKYPDLEGKVVLVTGATRGIGLAIAQNLSKQKAHVVFNFRGDEDRANSLKDQLSALGGTVSALKFDLTDPTAIKEKLDEFVRQVGPISGIVNNAGISKNQLALRLKDESISETLDINLKAPILICGVLSRGLLRATDASIVNISSVVGLMGNVGQATYAASKAGLTGLTKSLAKELGSKKVRCNAVCPGFIDTDMTKELAKEAKEKYLESIPLGRYGQAEEVAGLVSFLLSHSSSYITGEVIKIDGGLYI